MNDDFKVGDRYRWLEGSIYYISEINAAEEQLTILTESGQLFGSYTFQGFKGVVDVGLYTLIKEPVHTFKVGDRYELTSEMICQIFTIDPSGEYVTLVYANGSAFIRHSVADFKTYIDSGVYTLIEEKESVSHIDQSCSHSWSVYTGLTDTFNYCTKCDEKRK